MNLIRDTLGRSRYSARRTAKPTNFFCFAPKAQTVYLVGDFNNWLRSDPMHRRGDGWWFLQISLTHGHHHYRFLVDGEPVLDPRAVGTGRDDWNEPVSLIAVS